MLPWGHLAVGYLMYVLGCQLGRKGGPPAPEVGTLLVAVGTQFPDLVDKPLGWTVNILPSGRSLGHSVLVALVVLAVLWVLVSRIDAWSSFGVRAFGTGYLSHLFADSIFPFLGGGVGEITFLFWPVIPQPAVTGPDVSIVTYLIQTAGAPRSLFQWGLFAIALVVWYRHGYPGVHLFRGYVNRLIERSNHS